MMTECRNLYFEPATQQLKHSHISFANNKTNQVYFIHLSSANFFFEG